MALTPLMEKRLRRAFNARRIAVVGASPDQLSIGMGPMHNLLSSGFEGEVFPVNPKYTEVLGCKCYPDLESINPPPDLAVLMLNQHLAVEMAERAARHGVGAVTIVVGGFGEVGVDGESLHQRLKEIAQRYEMPVIGPNTLGFCCFRSGQNGIFWHFSPLPGKIALLSQSGGVGLTIAYCLQSLHCGLSHFVGVGNRTVVDFSDYLQILRDDSEIAVFVLFIEGVDCPRALYESLKAAALSRPVVVYKAGKNEVVSRATATHTGALTGDYQLYKSMFRQAGALEVSSCQDAAIAAKALSMAPAPAGNRLCALTFTAGPCIVAMDKLVDYGWELPELDLESRKKILSIIGENTPVEIQNPVDLTGPGFIPKNYISVLETVLRDDYDAYLLVWSFTPLIRMPAIELEMLIKKYAEKSVVLVVMGSPMETAPYVEKLASRGICVYATPEDGALALNALISRRRFLKRENSN
ncbi:MAG: CoA-binding protein [Syntrophobacteraceae bacterium]